jgi:bacteriorhodopsin
MTPSNVFWFLFSAFLFIVTVAFLIIETNPHLQVYWAVIASINLITVLARMLFIILDEITPRP